MTDEEISGPAAGGNLGWKPIVIVAIVVVAGVGGFIAYEEFLKPDPAMVTATISIDYGNGTVLTEEISCNNNTPLGLLKSFVGEDNVEESGGFVTAIHGIKTKDDVPGLEGGEDLYWLFYVNGEMPLESAAVFEVVDDDLVAFKFEPSPW
jgi:hypothetical protein